MPAVDGPSCGKCHLSEALCARTYPCCERCTHSFGHGDEPENKVEKITKRKAPRDTTIRHSLPEPFEGDWYVATSGRAHLWTLPTNLIAKCGRVREAPIGEPVVTWFDFCQSCEKTNDREWERREVWQGWRSAGG